MAYKKFIALVLLILFITSWQCNDNPVAMKDAPLYKIVFVTKYFDKICILENIYSPEIFELTPYGTMPKWSPNGDKIAYFSSVDNSVYSWGLFTISPNGKNKKLLTGIQKENQIRVLGLAWSPDGSKLAYVSPLNATPFDQNIWMIDADGQNNKQLTYEGLNLDPRWFPDGNRIAFFRGMPEAPQVFTTYILDINSGTYHRFYQGITAHLTFSPDGEFIAFSSKSDDTTKSRSNVFIATINETDVKQITNDTQRLNKVIGFSQDGTKIFFASCVDFVPGSAVFTTVEISSINIDGTHRNVLKIINNFASASLSPDRTKILVWAWHIEPTFTFWCDLYILSTDGKEFFKLIEEVHFPDWGPVFGSK